MEPLPPTTCPICLAVRQAQGFPVTLDLSQPLCDPCGKWEADKQYFESEAYQIWLSSVPTDLTFEQYREWVTAHPPPSRS